MKKRLLFLLAVLLIAAGESFAWYTGTYSGTFDGGEYVITNVNSAGVLSIVTHGKPMPDFYVSEQGKAPWVKYNDMYGEQTKIVKITTDASYIGKYAFMGLKYVSTIEAENCKEVATHAFLETGREGFTLCLPNVEEVGRRAFQQCNAGVIALPKLKKVPMECFIGCPYLKQVDLGEDLTEIGGWAFGCCPMMWIDNEPNIILHGSKMPEIKRGYFNSLEGACQPDTVNYERAYNYGTCFDDENLKKIRLLFPYITKVKHKKDCSIFYPQPDGLNFSGKPVILVSYDCYLNDKNLDSRISGWKDDANFYVGGRVETRENPISEKQTWRNEYIGWWHRGSLSGNEDMNICTYQWKLKEYISEEEAKAMFDSNDKYKDSSYDPTLPAIDLHNNLPQEAEDIKKLQLNSGMPWIKAMQASMNHGGVHVKTPVIIPLMFGPSLNCYSKNSAFEGVLEIGTGAFIFTGLRNNVDLSGVRIIGDYAFSYNNYLTEISLANLEKLGSRAFLCSQYLTKVVVGTQPELKEIPASAFRYCKKLDEVYIGSNITKIGGEAFGFTLLDCDNSEKGLFMSGKAPWYDPNAFRQLDLSKIYLHYPFAEYASYDADGSVWQKMNRVSDISFPILGDGWTLYADGEMDIFKDIPDYSNETQQPWAKYRRYIKYVNVEDGVTQIGNHAFHFNAEQSRLNWIELPASLKRIGNYAFAGNDELVGIDSPNTNAYDETYSKVKVYGPNFECIYLTDVEEIGDYAFADCSIMGSLVLGQSIKQLGKYIVKGCPVDYIVAYNAPISIDRYTFEGTIDHSSRKPQKTSDIHCDVRTEDFGVKLEYLSAPWWSDLHYALNGLEVWYNTSFRSANFALLSDSTLYIWPVGDATDLLSYETWERDAIAWDQREVSSKKIDFGADNKVANKVKRVEVMGNVKSLGGACCFLPNLKEIVLPESLKKLRGTFYGCEKLRDVNLPYVEVLGGATGVTVHSQVNRFDKETHGVDLYMGTFAHCPNLENVTMPKVHIIGDSTFTGCYSLDDDDGVDLMWQADTICSYAFKDCQSLDYVSVYNAKHLGTNVFAGCINVITADLGNQQPKSGLFDGCSKLEKVYMEEQIGTIGNKAFNGCNIKEIWISTPNPPDFDLNAKETIKDNIFNGQALSDINVYTYGDFIERYRETPGWKEMTVRVSPYIEKQAAIPAGGYLTDENWTNPAKWEITVGRSLNIYGKNVLDVGDYIDERVSYYWDYIDEIHINKGITELKTKIQGPRVLGSASSPWEFCQKVYIPSTMEKICNLAFNAHAVMGGNKITDVYCYAETPVDISYEYSEYDAGDKGKMIFGSTAFSAVMKYTGEGTEAENEEMRKDLAIPRLHVLYKKGVKEAYETAPGYKDSFLEIVADLAEDGEVVVLDKYSVTFVDWDDRWITTSVVEEGQAAVAPEDPTREGWNFSGWDTEFDNVTENITVKAKYEEQLFKVTLVAENGTILTNEEDPFDINTVPYGYTLHLTAEPDEGYEFDHWKNFNPETGLIVTRDTTVTAYFAKLHTVAFVDWDEKEISTQQVKNGSQATAPDDPTREGYTFLGWLSSANGQTMSATDINATAVTADVTYTAQYQGGPYQVTLVAEHGEIEVLNSGIDLNAVPENTVLELVWYTTEGGYKFDHWTNYNEETGLVVTSDTTVTAHFVMQTYTVTFLDWDETVLKEETVDWGGKVTAPADPTREGYTFTGWDTNEYIEVYDNITVHAQYQQDAVVHTLSFVDWNGDKIIDVKVVDGDNPLVPENPTREGYTFIGWLSSETSEIMSALEIGLNIVSADVTYTAQYEKSVIYHTVTFIDWNGDELYKEQVEDGKDAKGPDENPTREGYNFTGWSKPLTNITADRIIVAQYEVATVYYTVTYLDWNGDLIYSESVEEGKDAKGPDENPTREGYNFTGWSKPLTNITADRTVIAQYEKEIVYYTVTFKDWDGSTIATVKVEESKFATAPSDPTREGYTFTGWDKDFSNVTSDLTVTAQYTINVYTVTFIDKDGNTLKTEEVEHGKAATAPEAPVVEGWTFAGWDKAFNVIKSDLTVQATYTQNPVYTVTFVDWDGSIIATVKVEEGKPAVKPDDPIREGYTFTGWDKTFDNVKSDLTVKAQYTINVYTVTFVDKDGKTLKTEDVEYGKSATAPDAPAVEGYTFTGWDKAFDKVTSDLTVKAQYAINTYSVTFVDWDGAVLRSAQVVEYGAAAIPPSNPSREGYTFTGWDKDFSNVKSDLTVTAQYTINVYTVTFLDKDGKTLKTESVEYGKSATAPDAPVVEGWTFAGWDKAFNVVKSDLTVQATYTQNPVYTVTFVDWDGSIIATVKVEEGKSAVKPDDPIREGYTFIGWDKEFDNVTSDLTVTALYEEIIVVDYTPTNLSVVVEALGDDDQQITLSWNAVDGAASYDLRLLLGDKELYAGNTFGMHVISLKLSEILQIATIEPGTYSLDWFVRSTDDKAQAISDWAQGETFEVTVKDPGQGIEDINANANANARKEMRNGLLYILRGGRTYDSNGKLIQ